MSRTEGRGRRAALRALALMCLLGALALGALAWRMGKPLRDAKADYEAMRGRFCSDTQAGPDWESLQREYPGLEGWISAPDIGIDYPVMQADDNRYYLRHLPDGSYNSVGSVFLDADSDPLLNDPLTPVYGHHVSDGTMFSPLTGYLDGEFAALHPVMTWYTPRGAYTVEIVAAHETDGSDNSFLWEYAAADEQGRARWLEQLAERSAIRGPQPGPDDRLLALVTCTTPWEGASRCIVYGRLKEQA